MKTHTHDTGTRSGFNISRWALEHPALTRYLMVVLMVLGFAAYFQLGQDEDPPFTFRAMVVQAVWPGATAQQMADQVTDKIEKTLQEVPNADIIRSYTKPGESVTIFQIKDSSPPKEVPQIWYQTRKKIGDMRGTLPAGVIGPFFNDEFGDVYGVDRTRCRSRTRLQLCRAARALPTMYAQQAPAACPDVAKVETLRRAGRRSSTSRFHSKRLSQLGLDLNQVLGAAGHSRTPSRVCRRCCTTDTLDIVQVRVGGAVPKRWTQLAANCRSASTVRQRAVASMTKLDDVADDQARLQSIPPAVKVRQQRQAEVIALGVSMAKGGDIIAAGPVAHHARFNRIEDGTARTASTLVAGAGPAEGCGTIRSTSSCARAGGGRSIGRAGSELHQRWACMRAPIQAALRTVEALLRRHATRPRRGASRSRSCWRVTFLAMNYWGIGLHKISLGSLIIALGLLVDDAIIAVEMMVRKMEEGYDKVSRRHLCLRSDRDADAHGHAHHGGGLLADRDGEVHGGRVHVRDLRRDGRSALVISAGWCRSTSCLTWVRVFLQVPSRMSEGEHAGALFDTPFYNGTSASWSTGAWSIAGSRLGCRSVLTFALGHRRAWARCSSSSSPIRAGMEILVNALARLKERSFAARASAVAKRVEQRLQDRGGRGRR